MSFQIKDFTSITAAILNHARATTDKITDFVPGSVARTIMESPAVEIEELYLQMFFGLRDAIPVATYLSFGFDRLPAAIASGFVSVSTNDVRLYDVTIPAGTQFSTDDGRIYAATQTIAWLAGEPIVHIPVAYSVAGIIGNAEVGAVTGSSLFSSLSFNIGSTAMTGGRNVETDDERMARFAEFIAALSRGTVSACMSTVRNTSIKDGLGQISEYVTSAGIIEQPGYVRIYVYGNTGAVSDQLLGEAQRRIDGWRDELTGVATPGVRSAGVRVDVLRMATRNVDLSIAVEMLPGYTLNTSVVQQLTDIYASKITAIEPDSVLYLGVLIEALLLAEGVKAIVPTSTENIYRAPNESLLPGSLTIT